MAKSASRSTERKLYVVLLSGSPVLLARQQCGWDPPQRRIGACPNRRGEIPQRRERMGPA